MQRFLSFMGLFVITIELAGLACAQQPPQTLTGIAAHAGIIFRGRVVAVQLEKPGAPGEMANTLVTFRVEDGIRGATSGAMLTVRQWNATADEYRVGEELVLFLHLPSNELGLTSPVAGRAGHRRVEEVPAEVLQSLRSVHPAAEPVQPLEDGPNPIDIPQQRGKPLPHRSRVNPIESVR